MTCPFIANASVCVSVSTKCSCRKSATTAVSSRFSTNNAIKISVSESYIDIFKSNFISLDGMHVRVSFIDHHIATFVVSFMTYFALSLLVSIL